MPLHAAMIRSLAAASLELSAPPFFVIEHRFASPAPVVWAMHVDPLHLQRWWQPHDMRLSHLHLDLQPGGVCSFRLDAPGLPTLWNRWIYREIVPSKRLTALGSFIDERGRAIRNPLRQQWPLRFFCILTFEALSADQSRITCQAMPWNASEADHLAFHASHDSLSQGFRRLWQKLETYLATRPSAPIH